MDVQHGGVTEKVSKPKEDTKEKAEEPKKEETKVNEVSDKKNEDGKRKNEMGDMQTAEDNNQQVWKCFDLWCADFWTMQNMILVILIFPPLLTIALNQS